ncbi:MBL fold metallo-hydrolase [Gracilibacillus alcaliphilus]|uniref:MBL fold metallo-hydrolase n=1 Tax=Gracilibacillus alcaliphilus TaxID=1401441 RepID=UPI001957F0CB|nr:MBL fold metallo-hydrolase [Gracilibacillus alcaliphilus]MBM7677765.1 glyoxylase-like metal-dependent hydrolase (beta-lactamase superfamily II) [Gracilibacillus alcaliphilus]
MDKETIQKDIEENGYDFDHAVAEEICPDVAYYRTLFANVIMIGSPDKDWVLVDTGLKKYKNRILHACEERYGNKPPLAIVLTHGHFDHIGSAKALAKYWDVPVYMHQNELPYATGEASYPPGDPTVGGGVAMASIFFPIKPEHLNKLVHALPDDGSIPFLKEWRYIETPGHTKGHISLYREKDKLLIAGDALATEKAESSLSIFFPFQHVYGPPAYFTEDWYQAGESVKRLAQLQPETIIAGHGLPMEGEFMQAELQHLAENFDQQAIPKHKRH